MLYELCWTLWFDPFQALLLSNFSTFAHARSKFFSKFPIFLLEMFTFVFSLDYLQLFTPQLQNILRVFKPSFALIESLSVTDHLESARRADAKWKETLFWRFPRAKAIFSRFLSWKLYKQAEKAISSVNESWCCLYAVPTHETRSYRLAQSFK